MSKIYLKKKNKRFTYLFIYSFIYLFSDAVLFYHEIKSGHVGMN